jgi:hypothetical protein
MKEYGWNKRIKHSRPNENHHGVVKVRKHIEICLAFSFASSSSSSSLHYHQQTSPNTVLKKKRTFHLLSITLGVFYYFTVVAYEYICTYTWSYLYIYLLLLTASLSLSLSFFSFFFLSWSIWFKTIIFILMYILYGEKEKEVVWSHSFDTIGRHHFRQQYITDEKATIWLFLNI